MSQSGQCRYWDYLLSQSPFIPISVFLHVALLLEMPSILSPSFPGPQHKVQLLNLSSTEPPLVTLGQ